MTTAPGPTSAVTTTPGQNGRLVYEHIGPNSTYSIRTCNADGSDVRTIATNVRVYGNPAWSPDGKKILYAGGPWIRSQGTVPAPGLFIMGDDGSNNTRLTDDPVAFDPSFSPDGKTILFARQKTGTSGAHIYVMELDGSVTTRITDGSPAVRNTGPQWSPNGKAIVFSRDDNGSGGPHIYKMRPDGSSQLQLTTGTGAGLGDYDPVWSPDGSRIAFESRRDTTVGTQIIRQELYVMNSDGSGQNRLTQIIDHQYNTLPTWSPDGELIAFTRSHTFQDAHVWTMRPDGSSVQMLISGQGSSGRTDWESKERTIDP